jgi:DNA-binding transcriptional MerR regulator
MREKLVKSEVIKLYNTTKETLRYYEQKGLLNPEKTYNNYRYYDFKDLQQLRKIFFLKDLNFSIDEMKLLDKGKIKEDDYHNLLKSHHSELKMRIEKYKVLQENLEQLLYIQESSDNHYSFQVHKRKKRSFQLFGDFDGVSMISPKAFYDMHLELIHNDGYSLRTLQMFFPYDDLDSLETIKSKQCIETYSKTRNTDSNQDNIYNLPQGMYLSIFYPFSHKDEHSTDIKQRIDQYLKDNNLNRLPEMVLEIEHPELSIFTDEHTSIYEIQIHIQKA